MQIDNAALLHLGGSSPLAVYATDGECTDRRSCRCEVIGYSLLGRSVELFQKLLAGFEVARIDLNGGSGSDVRRFLNCKECNVSANCMADF